MFRSLWSSASGMRAGQLRVDAVAHNIANVNTTGYKRLQVEFADLLYQTTADGRLVVGNGVYPVAITRDLTPAIFEETGGPLDLAVAGEGFFVVEDLAGDLYYTRDGSFRLDGEGKIVTAAGMRLVMAGDDADALEGGSMVQLADSPVTMISVTEDGQVIQVGPDDDGSRVIGLISLARALPVAAGASANMLPVGGNLYVPAEGTEMELSRPGAEGAGGIRQGFLERSNVTLVDEMVDLITAQRAYELNARAVGTADNMLATANNIRRG